MTQPAPMGQTPESYPIGWARDVRHIYGMLRLRRYRAAGRRLRYRARRWRPTRPWQGELDLGGRCSCNAQRAWTPMGARIKMRRTHEQAMASGTCHAALTELTSPQVTP